MTSPSTMELLEPADLIRAAGRLSEVGFVGEHGHSPWLAVHVPKGEEGLVIALDASSSDSRAPVRLRQLEFRTQIASPADLGKMSEARATRKDPNVGDMTRVLGRRAYFCRVSKREGGQGALGDRISIGRAMNKDIVLRHPSISKFHAYLEESETGDWTIADAGSRNGTNVNGQPLPSRESRPVSNGDRVTLGSIETLFLDARTLWCLLRAL